MGGSSGTLWEREHLLVALRDQLSRAAEGRGRLVLVRGSTGVGKSAVVDAFAARARRVAEVVVGACDPLVTPRPFGPLWDMAPDLGPEVERALSRRPLAADALPEVFAAVLAALDGPRPTVMTIEDLHWADGATSDLVCLLARRVERVRSLVVVTYRDDEIGPSHALRTLLGGLAARSTVSRIAVEPLGRDSVAAMAAGHDVDADELHRLTGGNPFLVSAVLEDARPGTPSSVLAAVEGRLSAVSSAARALAGTVAVLGPHAPASLVTAVADVSTATELLDAGLLVCADHGLRFRSELTRAAVRQAVPELHRAEMSGRVLAALRSDPRWCDEPELLLHHADLACDGDAVVELAPPAAVRASEAGRHDDAVRYCRLALRYGARLSCARHAALWEHLARVCTTCARLVDAIDATGRAITLREEAGEHHRASADRRRLAVLRWLTGAAGPARALAARAVDELEALPPSRDLAAAHLTRCLLASCEQDGSGAVREHASRAVEVATRLSAHDLLRGARFHGAVAGLTAPDGAARAAARDDLTAVQVEARRDGTASEVALMATVATACATLHRHQDAGEGAPDDAATRPLLAVLATGWRALSRLHHGAWDQAGDLARSVLERPDVPALARVLPLVTLGRLRARRGEPGAWSVLDEAVALVEPAGWTLLVHAARAEVAWLDGDDARATAEAERGLARTGPDSDPWVRGELARWVGLAGGTPPTLDTDVPFAREVDGAWDTAAREWDELGCAYDAALARLAGDVPALFAAMTTFAALGARVPETVARSRLRAHGVRAGARGPRAETRTNDHGLTVRQTEILALVREGLTGPQIARRLHISPKTANNHVAAILDKMDVSSRAEARECAPATLGD